MDISTDDWIGYLDNRENGITPGMGWASYWMGCPICDTVTTVIMPIWTKGKWTCMSCRCEHPVRVWSSPAGSLKTDGGWLKPVGWKKAHIIEVN
jgi:hypothetical protein